MKDILNLIKARRSIRKYQDKEVSRDLIEKVLEAARWAPNGANLQPWQFIVVTNKELRAKIGKHAKFYFIKSHHVSEAPCVIVILGSPDKGNFYIIDCALAGGNMILEAQSLGLSTCWIGAFDEEKIKDVLNIPQELRIIGLITLGYAAESPSVPPRLPLKEIVHWEVFGSMPKITSKLTKSGPLTILDKILKVVLRR
jgi:nitroreductase